MLRISRRFVPLWLGLCLWFWGPEGASALWIAQLPRAGIVYVGEISDGTNRFPIAWASIDGTCSSPNSVLLFDLAGGAYPPGLNDNVELRGTNDAEVFVLVSTAMPNFCGTPWTMHPLRTNFFTLTVLGQGGGDWMDGGPTAGKVIRGGAGADLLVYRGSSILNQVFGDAGDDMIIGNGGDYLNGNADNDLFCVAPGTTATLVSGSTGDDKLCGAASTRTSVTVQTSAFCTNNCFY